MRFAVRVVSGIMLKYGKAACKLNTSDEYTFSGTFFGWISQGLSGGVEGEIKA
jgi:hypothetical protein